jgi:Mg-chelatase subunit ChlD
MTTANKKKTNANIERLQPGSITNLWQGILSGIGLFEKDSRGNGRVPAIMVLTDGMPNHM